MKWRAILNVITNIQKYSIHDGDGIRTTVFFKGCPLRCVWCHNPETQRFERELQFDQSKCTGCRRCEQVCPQHAISFSAPGAPAKTDPEKCTLCGRCTDRCVNEARDIIGETYSQKELMKELLKDRIFYEQSGGGVTLSGGEVMAQQEFSEVVSLASKLHRNGIAVNIDTCGYAPYERFREILPYTDTFLYDIKVMDPETHRRVIGTDNKQILDNLKCLSRDGAKIYLRIPTIPGISGTKENMDKVIAFLKENDIRPDQINLLPYHDTGKGKYAKLGRNYPGEDCEVPSSEMMDAFSAQFTQAGFSNVKIGG